MQYLNKVYNLDSLKLDLGSGTNPKEGFIGIDNFVGIKSQHINPETVDTSKVSVIQHDLSAGIPFESDSIEEVYSAHFLEHFPDENALYFIFEEVHRVLKDNCQLEIIVPYANSAEGMYAGHKVFFTEKWFQLNIVFNKLFTIREIHFWPSEYYMQNRERINKFLTFDEARLFLFNCCNTMRIISLKKGGNVLQGNNAILYKVITQESIDAINALQIADMISPSHISLFKKGMRASFEVFTGKMTLRDFWSRVKKNLESRGKKE